MIIRNFKEGEENALHEVFLSSVHQLANQHYSSEQLNAWAPAQYDQTEWFKHICTLQPFVAEINGQIAGYADLQSSGYIDHFFVAASYANRGVGSALMAHIHSVAEQSKTAQLFSHVSLTAESFFLKHGFIAEANNSVVVNNVAMSNVRMYKNLLANPSFNTDGSQGALASPLSRLVPAG
jgi:putative acetyltransferase